jgi:hypothetical protein
MSGRNRTMPRNLAGFMSNHHWQIAVLMGAWWVTTERPRIERRRLEAGGALLAMMFIARLLRRAAWDGESEEY